MYYLKGDLRLGVVQVKDSLSTEFGTTGTLNFSFSQVLDCLHIYIVR